MKSKFQYITLIILVTYFHCYSQDFQEIATALPNISGGEAEWGDYDNDGDLDILLIGTDQSYNKISRVYRNSGGGVFDYQSQISITGVMGGTADWIDYDNDGDLDIMLTGYSDSGYISRIWRNNGNNTFTEQTNISFIGVASGSVAWGDYNNDGDPDVIITGADENYKRVSKVFRNNGNDSFTEQTGITLTGVAGGSADWGDYDNDGDLDILLTGESDSYKISKIFSNNGDNTFTEQSGISLTDVRWSSAGWCDYDNDGDLDILLTGDTISNLNTPGYISKVYRNTGNNTFTEQTSISLTGVSESSAACGDYDNDGDPDVLITGSDINSNRISKLFRNNGDDTFTEQTGITLLGLSNSSVAWGDYDNDGDLDILMTGYDNTWKPATRLYRNNGITFNTKPATPNNLSQSVSGQSVNLAWNRSTDTQTPQTGLSYNLSVSTLPTGSNVRSPDAILASGYRKVVKTGEIKDNEYIIHNLNTGTYYWSVQAIDAAYTGSAFSSQGNFTVSFSNSISPVEDQYLAPDKSGNLITVSETEAADSRQWMYSLFPGGPYNKVLANETSNSYTPRLTEDHIMYIVCISTKNGISVRSNEVKIELFLFDEQTTINFPGISHGSLAWGDYDNDEDLDILICGMDDNSTGISKVFRNNGNNSFTEQTGISLTGVYHSSSDWVDYDNDGDLDIMITGRDNSNINVSRIYKNNGDNTFTEQTGIVLIGVYYSSTAWGDYDNDGDLDILLTGRNQSETRISRIYKNNGNDSFSEQTGISITAVDMGDCSWADYDNDGDLDILVTGYNSVSGSVSKIFRNNGNNTFTEQTSISLSGVYYSSVAWGDYDNNEYADILLCGYNTATTQIMSKVYKNNGNNSFTEQTGIKITGSYLGSAEWGDYDNDGDLDIILSGSNSSGIAISEIYRNNGSNNFTKQISNSFFGVYYGKMTLADYDNDKDLDILLSGNTGTAIITKIYRNNCEVPNTPPGPPKNLDMTMNGTNITLTWYYPEDKETHRNGLSYNLRIGTSPGSFNIKSASASGESGYYHLVGHGNVGHTLSWTIKDLPPGTYYWSVQAIDHGYLPSEFAPEITFGNYFTESGISYNASGKPYLGDYDRDGDLDILVGNSNATTVYRNDVSTGSGFTDIIAGLPKTYGGDNAFAWGDYDNDGDLDIAYTGYWGEFITKIFRNENGIFTDINAGMQGVWMGTVAWGDYDNDGDLDLFVYGNHEHSDDGEPIGILYRNDGNDTFANSETEIEDSRRGDVALADFNNDGFLDVLICGYNLSTNIFTSILRNNKDNTFTNINAGIEGYSYGGLCWGDYDSDSDMDICITGGLYGGEGNTRIYQNQGNETFTNIGLALPGGAAGYNNKIMWGDYDNDGDLDVLLPEEESIIRNEGDNNFTIVNIGIDIGSGGTWGDIDNDGDLDIVSNSAIFLNNMVIHNTSPDIPDGLQSKISGNQATISWKKSTDETTPANGITYNVCVGTRPGVWDILSPMVDVSSGYRKSVPGMGNAMTNTFKIIKDLPIRTYYWSVQAVDNGYMTSGFSPVDSFEILPMFTILPDNSEPLYNINRIWGDYDNDGDLDFLENDRYSSKMSIWEKDTSDNFVENEISIPTTDFIPSLVDYDNDGDLDVITSDSIFRNDQNNIFAYSDVCFPDTVQSFITGDYDADGDIDILAKIYENTDDKLVIYRNEKNNIFTRIDLNLITDDWIEIHSWFDYDNDWDLDIVLIYGPYENKSSQIFRNDGGNNFTNINTDLIGLRHSTISFADYDNDSDLDILMVGTDNNYNHLSKIYRNEGNDSFTDINTNIRGFYDLYEHPGTFWGDYNNDGFIDVVISGINNGRERNKLYLNDQDGTFTEIGVDNIIEYIKILSCGDYDNDGDLDALTDKGIFRNNTNPPREVPQVITNLSSDLKGLNCLLSWDLAKDAKGAGYSYNFKIGTTPVICDIKSPISTPGFGNVPTNNSFLIHGLSPGLYYWSVQAVNQTYSAGPWAPVKSFLITDVSPDFSFDTVCNGIQTNFTDLSVTTDIIIKWKWNFGDGTASNERNPVHLYQVADTFDVSLWAYSQTGDSAERVRQVIVKPSPYASFSVSPVCKEEPSILENHSIVDGITVDSWLWDFGNGEFSSVQNTVQKTYIRSDTAFLTIVAENGCWDADTQIVTVAEYPNASIYLSPGFSNVFCTGDSTILIVPYNEKYNYQWKYNGVNIFGAAESSLNVKGPGGEYSIEAKNPVADCISGSSIEVSVHPSPFKPVIESFNYEEGNCPGENMIRLSASQTIPEYQYQWYKDGLPLPNETMSNLELNEQGNYKLEANLSGCKSESDIFIISFPGAPEKPFIYVFGPNVWYLVCSDTTASKYKWYCNGNLIEGADEYYYVANRVMGNYQVSIANYLGCYVRSEIVTIPTGTTGIEYVDPFAGLMIYPNPTKGLFTIEMDNMVFGELMVKIITDQGKEIQIFKSEKTTAYFSCQVDLTTKAKGMYIVYLMIEKYFTTRKLVVE